MNAQAVTVFQELLEQNALGLRDYENSFPDCPLRFDLITSGASLKKNDVAACLSLIEYTSGRDYKTSGIGWNPRKKRNEMTDENMVYLLCRENKVAPHSEGAPSKFQTSSDGSPTDQITNEPGRQSVGHDIDLRVSQGGTILGFISFMLTFDDPPHENRDVIYIYEIHMYERLRGKGLGSSLIKYVEHAAIQQNVSKTMLTVFTANEDAKRMYEKLGYSKDACSPVDRRTRNKIVNADYVVMSRILS